MEHNTEQKRRRHSPSLEAGVDEEMEQSPRREIMDESGENGDV